MDRLKQFNLVYLGTPYSKYPLGIEMAFRHAAELAGRLVSAGVTVYSPIAHTHPIAIYAKLNPLDYHYWLKFDEVMMRVSDAIVVAKMESWEDSYGLAHEVQHFEATGKPVFYLNPATLAVEPKSADGED